MAIPKSEIRNPKSARRRPSALCPLPSIPRRGFTLVELLVTISIIAIMASLLLFAMYNAQEQARLQKTRSTIAKLHNMMMQRWESYQTRRVPINIPAGTPPNVAAVMRLVALRELMRLELPDRNGDILVPQPSPNTLGTNLTVFDNVGVSGNTVKVPWPSLNASYRRRLGTPTNLKNTSAECLYLILTSPVDDDAVGREQFGENEIGDTDNDGHPEFVDAWRNPIAWIRWPAGFVSELQPLDPSTGLRDPLKNHDPFDPRRVDTSAYALTPLIFSSGPDGLNEIASGVFTSPSPDVYDYLATTAVPPFSTINNPANMASGPPRPLDPYVNLSPQMGVWNDTNSDTVNDSLDNIHNHLIGLK